MDDRELYQKLYDARNVKHPIKGVLDRYGDSTIRNKWIIDAVKKHVAPISTVLDVGCGRGHLMRSLISSGYNLTGCDIVSVPEHKMLFQARVTDCSILDLEDVFGQDSFDAVVCSDVLEHLDPGDLHVAIANLGAVARKHMVISVGLRPAKKYPKALGLPTDDLHRILGPPAFWDVHLGFFMDIIERGPTGCQSYYVYGTRREPA